MKNKGFTLVEMLAVIVIMAILITVSVTGVLSMSKKTKNEMYNTKVGMIEKAGQSYAEDNRDLIEDGSIKRITVSDLLRNNYLKKESKDCIIGSSCIKDVRDNSSMDNMYVCICMINRRPMAIYNGTSTDCNSTACGS